MTKDIESYEKKKQKVTSHLKQQRNTDETNCRWKVVK